MSALYPMVEDLSGLLPAVIYTCNGRKMRKIHKYHEHVGNRCTWWFIHVGGFIYEKGSHFIIHFGHFFYLKSTPFWISFFSCFPFHMWWCMFFLLFTSQTLSDFICKPSLNLNINDSIEFFFGSFFSHIWVYGKQNDSVPGSCCCIPYRPRAFHGNR